ncbi:MAG: RNA polymerase sigma factor [Acidobacteria bacterium]|nr:RNA polymerase sigma factor [Acidobacteriota bacterium]
MTPSSAHRDAFLAQIERHRKIVLKVVHTYCWTADDRDDLAQDILAQLWRAYPSYDPARPFPTWMYRVALNVAISWVRGPGARQRVTVPFDADLHDVPGAAPDPVGAERQRVLGQVIQALDPLNRALLLLYLDDHSYRDIAAVLGITETNVATKIGRLKLRIKQDLGHLA